MFRRGIRCSLQRNPLLDVSSQTGFQAHLGSSRVRNALPSVLQEDIRQTLDKFIIEGTRLGNNIIGTHDTDRNEFDVDDSVVDDTVLFEELQTREDVDSIVMLNTDLRQAWENFEAYYYARIENGNSYVLSKKKMKTNPSPTISRLDAWYGETSSSNPTKLAIDTIDTRTLGTRRPSLQCYDSSRLGQDLCLLMEVHGNLGIRLPKRLKNFAKGEIDFSIFQSLDTLADFSVYYHGIFWEFPGNQSSRAKYPYREKIRSRFIQKMAQQVEKLLVKQEVDTNPKPILNFKTLSSLLDLLTNSSSSKDAWYESGVGLSGMESAVVSGVVSTGLKAISTGSKVVFETLVREMNRTLRSGDSIAATDLTNALSGLTRILSKNIANQTNQAEHVLVQVCKQLMEIQPDCGESGGTLFSYVRPLRFGSGVLCSKDVASVCDSMCRIDHLLRQSELFPEKFSEQCFEQFLAKEILICVEENVRVTPRELASMVEYIGTSTIRDNTTKTLLLSNVLLSFQKKISECDIKSFVRIVESLDTAIVPILPRVVMQLPRLGESSNVRFEDLSRLRKILRRRSQFAEIILSDMCLERVWQMDQEKI